MKARHILIVEDNPMNLEMFRDLLEAGGFLVTFATTAEEGLRLARQQPPDLVLMDLNLPGMDGLSATKLLNADPATRHLIVVGLSANAMKGDEEAALNAGCAGYLTKPINSRTFAATLTAFLQLDKLELKQSATQ